MRSSNAVLGRALIAVAGVLVVALAVVVAVRVLGGDSPAEAGQASATRPSSSPSSSVRVTQLPTAAPSSAPRLDSEQKTAAAKATDRLVSFLSRSSAALARNDGKADLGSYAAGPALGEIESLAVQYDKEQLTIHGAPRVLGSEILAVNLSSSPRSATVAVCLDNSPVIVRDVKGRNLSKRRSASELTVLNLYELQQVADDWMVVNHAIPADSSCKQMKLS